MAENLMGHAFTGGTSFMTNRYVIWRKGLKGGSDQPARPNWYAVQQGETYADKMFFKRSMDKRSSYYQFITFLEKIEKKEADKERRLIETTIENIKKASGGQGTKQIQLAERAMQSDDYGLAYFFLVQNEEEINKFIDEILNHKTRDISHSSLFWDAEFSTHLEKKLTKWFDKIYENGINESLTLEELVDSWVEQAVLESGGIVPQSLHSLKESVTKNLKHYFSSRGLTLSSSTQNKTKISPTKLKKYLSENNYLTTKTGRNRKIETTARMFGRDIANAVAKGFGQELSQTGKQGRTGFTFNTGAVRKELEKVASQQKTSVQIKNDVISYVMAEVLLNKDSIISAISDYAAEDQIRVIAEVEDQLNKIAQASDTKIFKVVTNVKGYQSRHNLQIEGEGSFAQRGKNLMKIAEEAEGLPKYSMEKILFMLNNTIPGCLNENRIHYIVDYIAAICVAWMWDDYTDLLSVEERGGSMDTIHIFSTGGVYYSSSQILRQTREDLEKQSSSISFVDVSIKPPSFDAEAIYTDLRNRYPVEDIQDHQARQNQLAQRWNAMRDIVEAEGTIGISFKQKELENIISDIEGVLNL